MSSPLDNSLNRALSVRLSLQVSLSSLPVVEEWMDIHLDRWLEHVPMPPEMPDGHAVSYQAMIGSDLRRLVWGAWGNPRGFVPKMADYFRLCNMAKSDESILDQIGLAFEPQLVGSWVGVWGGKVVTGWHFWDPHDFAKLEPLFGTHEAKFQIKKWVTDNGVERFQRFAQSIGEDAFSEIELPVPGETIEDQVATMSGAFHHFTGAPLDASMMEILRSGAAPGLAIAVRIRGGQVVRFGGLAGGLTLAAARDLARAGGVKFDDGLERIVNTMSAEGISRVEYGRAGEHAGLDIFVEPTEPARKPAPGEPSPASQAN
ncbi:MAG: hypothetical protein H6709_03765 [Kofleriaceae bacterium]|nr:hypothetical protein [Myxococcales bacterium]MCB9560248.1 hypothetical protein [Kofleriaceae bacterium]MCB9571187.1 hypothetical protein [Kofleriaceae bacterium]